MSFQTDAVDNSFNSRVQQLDDQHEQYRAEQQRLLDRRLAEPPGTPSATGVSPGHAPSGSSTTARATSWRKAASKRNAPLKPCHELTKASTRRRMPESLGRSCMTDGSSLATLIGQIQLFRGADVVQPADRQSIRCALDLRGVLFGLALDRNHRLDEGIELFLGLGLGRLDQQALRHEQ